MSTARLAHALSDLDRARDLVGLGRAFNDLTVGRVGTDDVYRAALVQAVSALDHYMHGIVIDRAVDMVCGRLADNGKESLRVGLSFEAVREIMHSASEAEREVAARKHAAARLGRETLQYPDDIADALALVGVPAIWSRAFGEQNAKQQKVALGTIVSRRNKIVHQSDGDPLNPGTPTAITADDAAEAVARVRVIVTAIDACC